jgi:hypothetical protein
VLVVEVVGEEVLLSIVVAETLVLAAEQNNPLKKYEIHRLSVAVISDEVVKLHVRHLNF